MPVTRLETHRVNKVWGRRDLPQSFPPVAPGGEPVGEIWFARPDRRDDELLVKYIFTSERLSIQVHPDDEMARAAGHPRGKDEAWLVLSAEPGSSIAIGTRQSMSAEQLRAASLDGSIETLVEWHPVKSDDFFYSPSGTVHAIGAGLTLIEVQQNLDLTYRLYDYGRPRELHLDDAVAAARPAPFVPPPDPVSLSPGRLLLVKGPAFVMERWTGASTALIKPPAGPLWVIPINGRSELGGETLEPGSVWIVEGEALVSLHHGSDLLIAYPGAQLLETKFPAAAGQA